MSRRQEDNCSKMQAHSQAPCQAAQGPRMSRGQAASNVPGRERWTGSIRWLTVEAHVAGSVCAGAESKGHGHIVAAGRGGLIGPMEQSSTSQASCESQASRRRRTGSSGASVQRGKAGKPRESRAAWFPKHSSRTSRPDDKSGKMWDSPPPHAWSCSMDTPGAWRAKRWVGHREAESHSSRPARQHDRSTIAARSQLQVGVATGLEMENGNSSRCHATEAWHGVPTQGKGPNSLGCNVMRPCG